MFTDGWVCWKSEEEDCSRGSTSNLFWGEICSWSRFIPNHVFIAHFTFVGHDKVVQDIIVVN